MEQRLPAGQKPPRKEYAPGFRTRRFLNWFPLGLMYAAFYMGRYNITVANPYICSELGWTKAQFGIVISACLIVYGLAVFLNGPMADRIGGRRAILIGALGAAFFNIVFGAGIFTRFMSYFILVGMVQYYFQTFGALSVVKVNAAWFHISERGFFAGLFGAMIQLGRFFAVGIGGFIVAALPWQWVFWIPSMVLLANFVLTYIFVRNTPEELGYARVDDRLAHEETNATEEKPTVGGLLRVLFSSPTLVIIAMSMMCTGVVRHSIEQWGPAYFIQVHGLSTSSFVYQFAFIGQIISAILGSMVLGTLSDRYFQSRRGPVTAISYLIQAVLLLIFGLIHPGPWGAAIMLILVYFFLNGCHGLLAGTASMDFGGRKAAASAAGMLDGAQYLAGSTVGIGMGALLDAFGWQVWTYAVVPLGVVAAVLMATRWRTLPRKTGEQDTVTSADQWGVFFVGLFLFPLVLLIWAFAPESRRAAIKKATFSGAMAGLVFCIAMAGSAMWIKQSAANKKEKDAKAEISYTQLSDQTLKEHASRAVFSVAPGFSGDPIKAQSTTMGVLTGIEIGNTFPAHATARWSACKGYYAQKPNHALEIRNRFEMLRVYAISDADTTLMIRYPTGELVCVDDTGIAGKNPIIGRSLMPGVYTIWVGSHQKQVPTNYTLGFTAKTETRIQ